MALIYVNKRFCRPVNRRRRSQGRPKLKLQTTSRTEGHEGLRESKKRKVYDANVWSDSFSGKCSRVTDRSTAHPCFAFGEKKVLSFPRKSTEEEPDRACKDSTYISPSECITSLRGNEKVQAFQRDSNQPSPYIPKEEHCNESDSDSDCIILSCTAEARRNIVSAVSLAWKTTRDEVFVPQLSMRRQNVRYRGGQKVQVYRPVFSPVGISQYAPILRSKLKKAINSFMSNGEIHPFHPISMTSELRREDIVKLDPSEWLSVRPSTLTLDRKRSSIINTTLNLLWTKHFGSSPKRIPQVYTFSTHFFAKLVEGVPLLHQSDADYSPEEDRCQRPFRGGSVCKRRHAGKPRQNHGQAAPAKVEPVNLKEALTVNYDAVRSWTKLSCPLDTAETIIIPVNECDEHWLIIAISTPRQQVILLDSLFSHQRESEYRSLLLKVWAWMLMEMQDKLHQYRKQQSETGGDAVKFQCHSKKLRVDKRQQQIFEPDQKMCGYDRYKFKTEAQFNGSCPFERTEFPVEKERSKAGDGKSIYIHNTDSQRHPKSEKKVCGQWQTKWRLRAVGGLPQQQDDTSCGAFALAFADCLMQGWWPEDNVGSTTAQLPGQLHCKLEFGSALGLRSGILKFLTGPNTSVVSREL